MTTRRRPADQPYGCRVEEEGYRQLALARTRDEEAELGALRERRRSRMVEDD